MDSNAISFNLEYQPNNNQPLSPPQKKRKKKKRNLIAMIMQLHSKTKLADLTSNI